MPSEDFYSKLFKNAFSNFFLFFFIPYWCVGIPPAMKGLKLILCRQSTLAYLTTKEFSKVICKSTETTRSEKVDGKSGVDRIVTW